MMTSTDSAASAQPPWVVAANFGVFAIEKIETPLRGALLDILKPKIYAFRRLPRHTTPTRCNEGYKNFQFIGTKTQAVSLKYALLQRLWRMLRCVRCFFIAPVVIAV